MAKMSKIFLASALVPALIIVMMWTKTTKSRVRRFYLSQISSLYSSDNLSNDAGDFLFDVSKTVIDLGRTVVDSGAHLSVDTNIYERRAKELKNEVFTCGYRIQHFLSLRDYFLEEGRKLQDEYRGVLGGHDSDEPPPLELASSTSDLFGDSDSDVLEYI